MADITTAGAASPPAVAGAASGGGPFAGFRVPTLKEILGVLRSTDVGLAAGVLGIIVVLILPMPSVILDCLLALSIIFSVLIMMTALFIQAPLEFSSFPTVLLIAAMLRLALNLASTRLILSNGHSGTDAAGHVIEAFGHFIMGSNFVIGVVVFAILVIVNFVVITKGSGRIAEVAARFSLDAMPGKQMAIDADLSAGLINEKEAKKRRANLEAESAFFGNMDGASKFVRGDAIAGLLITFINIIAGMIIGVLQQGLSFQQAASNYTVLTVGDGLVSQIPSLIVSTAAGLLVSKAGIAGSADKALIAQFTGYPKALGMSAAVMALLAFLPGMPFIPFLALAGGAGYLAFTSNKKQTAEKAKAATEAVAAAAAQAAENGGSGTVGTDETPIKESLKIDELKLELGYGLLALVKEDEGGGDRLTDQIKALRRQLASELGFVMPAVRILDNMQLEPNVYKVRIKEVEAGHGEVRANQLMVMDPTGKAITLPGFHTTEPTFGLPATWIEAALRDEAELKGYSIIDPSTVVSTHLTEILKGNVAELLSYSNVQTLLSGLTKEQQKLVEDIVPGQISVSGVQRVLQALLAERISIRDLPTILEGIAEIAAPGRSTQTIVEHVRARLGRQICAANLSGDNALPLLTLSPQWERDFAEAMVGEGESRHLAMAPSRLQQFIVGVQRAFEQAAQQGELPVLITSPSIRPHVRSIVERFRPQTVVMSQTEVHPRVRLKTVGSV